MLRESGSLFGAETAGGEWITAYCDGGSRGNPGPAGYGVWIQGADGQSLAELSDFLGRTTNNVAEYSGLLAALDFALANGHRRLRVVSDSELMVKQMQGRYKVNSADLRPLYDEAKRRAARLEGFRIEHVLRGKNQRADRLANLAMDRGTGRPGSVGDAATGKTGHPGGTSRPGGTGRPGTGRPGSVGPSKEQPVKKPEPPKAAKGYVKGGVVHLIEGELPEGAFVRVVVDRQ